MVKGSLDSISNEDVFVCERCAINLYVDKDSIEIADVETILDWLNLSENNLAKIDHFRESYSLDGLWKKMLPDLEAYTIKNIELKDDLETAENENDWEKIPKIQIQSKMLLSSIFKSKLYKEYIKQINYMKFCDLEAKKKLIKSSYKPLEKSKDINEKSEHDKIFEQLQEAKNLIQQKDDLISQKDAEIKKKDQLIVEKAKIVTEKGNQIKNSQKIIDQKKQTIEQKDQQIFQQDCQMDKLANDRLMSKTPSQILNSQKSHLEQEHSKKDQNIKELQKKLDDLEKKDKIQQNIIEQLQKMTTQQKEDKDRDSTHEHQKDSFESKNTSKLLKDQEKNKVGNMEKVLEQQLAICKDTQALIDTLSTSNKKNQKFPLKEFMTLKDTELCDSKGETPTNVDPSIIKRTVKEVLYPTSKPNRWKESWERELEIYPNYENLSGKTQLEPRPEPTSQSTTSVKNTTKTSKSIEEPQTLSLDVIISIRNKVTTILSGATTKIEDSHKHDLDTLLISLSGTLQRRVFVVTILTKAIEEKDRVLMYGSLLCEISKRESERFTELKKQQSQEFNEKAQQEHFEEELTQALRFILKDILTKLSKDIECKSNTSENVQSNINNLSSYSSLFSYLRLEGELFKHNLLNAFFEIETLHVLLGRGTENFKLKESEATIIATCLFLQDIGLKLDEKISANLKDGVEESIRFRFAGILEVYHRSLDILDSYKNRKDLTPRLKQLTIVTLILKMSCWKAGGFAYCFPEDSIEKPSVWEETKQLPTEFGYISPRAFQMVLMSLFFNWVKYYHCSIDFMLSFTMCSYGEQILLFYLKSVFFLGQENYDCFPSYFLILFQSKIFSVQDVENGLASYFKLIPQLGAELPNFGNALTDLIFFIFIFHDIGNFERVLKKTEFKMISELEDDSQCIDIIFEIFSKLLYKIQMTLGDDKMMYFYSQFNIQQPCKLLKPLIKHPRLFDELVCQGVPPQIISLINIS
ncbi:unnamed protein product [Moneuplotes crassus]|uniref:Uncharacterized protein n=1 Tax=Euplotes crassus TaxID=5936 RepID=A0AAD1XZ74_EUPCR|nr:unnamed protein product [Moneuplotes crassus]